MVWDSNAPLELLMHMPIKLNKDDLKSLQEVIDADKYKASSRLNRDLCGEYAPFCSLCNKSAAYPCATAFVRMKQSEGVALEIAAADDSGDSKPDLPAPAETDIAEPQETALAAEDAVITIGSGIDVSSEYAESHTEDKAKEDIAETKKLKIRIAVAKKKNRNKS